MTGVVVRESHRPDASFETDAGSLYGDECDGDVQLKMPVNDGALHVFLMISDLERHDQFLLCLLPILNGKSAARIFKHREL